MAREEKMLPQLSTGLGAYSGNLEYVTGYNDSGKAIQLGDYGLELNRKNLGENFTVSLWHEAGTAISRRIRVPCFSDIIARRNGLLLQAMRITAPSTDSGHTATDAAGQA